MLSKEQLLKKYKQEKVFVVPYEKVKDYEDGFVLDTKSNLLDIEQDGFFMLRAEAEYNLSFAQLIPYILVVDSERRKIYAARRKQGDERLVNKWSFFGGHINIEDIKYGKRVIYAGAEREITEELFVQPKKGKLDFKLIGHVQDKTSATSEHFGFVLVLDVNNASIKETDNLEGKWFNEEDIIFKYPRFETWAKYIIEIIYEMNKKKTSIFELI